MDGGAMLIDGDMLIAPPDIFLRARLVAREARALLKEACVEPVTRRLPELFDDMVRRPGLNVKAASVLQRGSERECLLEVLGESRAPFVALLSATADLGRALYWLKIRKSRGASSQEDAAPARAAVLVLAFHSLALLRRALRAKETPYLFLEVIRAWKEAHSIYEPTWQQSIGSAAFAAALRSAEESFEAAVLSAEEGAAKLAAAAAAELNEAETCRRAEEAAEEAFAAAARDANRQRPVPDLPPPKSVKAAKAELAVAMKALSVAETCLAMARPSHKAEALVTARAKRGAANRARQELALARLAAEV
jgi:hypothetical protein